MTHAAPELSKLSVAEKDALILALFEQLTTAHQRITEQDKIIAAQAERIAALEAKLEQLNRPPKTPDNSSMPPSKGQKKDPDTTGPRPPAAQKPAGRRKVTASQPRPRVDATLSACPSVGRRFGQPPRPSSRSTTASNFHRSNQM